MATRYAFVELESTKSTQDEARERYPASGATLIVARRQTAGRGRLGRAWVQADRAMYASFAFPPVWPADSLSLVPLVAGLAVRSAIEDLTGVLVGLRWPNDLMLGDGKLGGIIVESGNGPVIVGCGINFEWESPIDGAVALDRVTDVLPSGIDLAGAWVDRFLTRMDRFPDEWGADEYRAVCRTIGRSVSYTGGSGRAVGVSDDGSLLVEVGEGLVAVRSGEVRLHDVATLPMNRRD